MTMIQQTADGGSSEAKQPGAPARATNSAPRSRALACYRELRVNILRVHVGDDWRPVTVLARVRSSRGQHHYRIQFRDGAWTCTCPDGVRGEQCPHVLAVSYATTASAT